MVFTLPGFRLPVAFTCALFLAACESSDTSRYPLRPAEGASLEVPQWTVEHSGLYIRQMVLDDSGNTGWALASDKRVFRLSRGQWTLDTTLVAPVGNANFSFHLGRDGRSGWIFSDRGVLRYTGARWEMADSLLRADAAWVSSDGARGWAFSSNRSYRLSGGRWVPQPPGPLFIDFVAFNDEGTVGWAETSLGEMARFAGGRWAILPKPAPLRQLRVSSDGIALGVDYGGGIWRGTATEWVREDSVAIDIADLWVGPGGHRGWIVGSEGVYQRQQGHPLHRVLHALPGVIEGIWMNRDGSRGVVYGEEGILAQFRDGQWHAENPLRAFAGGFGTGSFHAIWMDAEGTRGWAVTRRGLVVRY
ncbi:MAG TPA: hypothetical protein VEW03_07875, partial [Longimicrobiaceae bacterium]|nr:hypothetical protein [Longimicrobiaceae bacterium]